jgi:hypothetical protein
MKVTSVTAVTCYGSDGVTVSETFDATDITDLAVYPYGKIVRRSRGSFPAGHLNVKLTYVHGLASVPADIKEAALVATERYLIPSPMPHAAISGDGEQYNWEFNVDPARLRWCGLNKIDGVLNRYRSMYYTPAIG